MNQDWKNFLLTQGAQFESESQCEFEYSASEDSEKLLFALTNLAILQVTGQDAAQFLQGQCTCNINDLTDTQGSFGAFCSPKGRALCVFFIIKHQQGFLLIMAADLLETISKRLQMYILRSNVTLQFSILPFNLIGMKGLTDDHIPVNASIYSVTRNQDGLIIRLPGVTNRFIAVIASDHSEAFWLNAVATWKFQTANSTIWQKLDIQSGIPWLNSTSSDEYIPQMLNLDQLNGISFNKGCYTGQEIIARTHYKGKAKRQMFLGQATLQGEIGQNATIIDQNDEQQTNVGKILLRQTTGLHTLMLAVIQISHAQSTGLCMDSPHQEPLTISEFNY